MKSLGNYWIVTFYYLVLLFLLSDIIFLFFKVLNLRSSNIYGYINSIYYSGGFVILLSAAIIIYGAFNAYSYKPVYYDITVNKEISDINELKIAMIADLHYDKRRIDYFCEIISLINKESVDLICLCGDIIDENTNKKDLDKLVSDLKKLKATYGLYAVNGNHESYLDYHQEYKGILENNNILLLEDKAVSVNDMFYIVGRKDVNQERISSETRLNINDLIKAIDKDKFILLLDHQPVDIESVENTSVDLQLSGHTHKGQFSPNDLITRLMFKKDHGLYQNDGYSLIVTSGVGTWGPPVRVGSSGEVVFIRIKAKSR